MQASRGSTLKVVEETPALPPEPVPPPVMAAAPRKMENAGGREYKYFTEISQMMFVFGEVQDPLPETVNLVEDIVRSQIIELVGSHLSRPCTSCVRSRPDVRLSKQGCWPRKEVLGTSPQRT